MLTWFLAGFVVLGLIYLAATRAKRRVPAAVREPEPAAASPQRLVIHLPDDRDRYGALYLRDAAGGAIEGPFAAVGRAADALAQRGGNPGRLPTRPYGDTPLGLYRIKRLEPSPSAPWELASHGPHGRIILAPVAGDAALAEAAGRFEIAIQGGPLGPGGALHATDGAVRVHDRTIWILLEALRGSPRVPCEIVPLVEGDPALDDWNIDDGIALAYDDAVWDPAWPDPAIPVTGFTPDVGASLTGTIPSPAEQMVAVALAGEVAAAGEFLADDAYAP